MSLYFIFSTAGTILFEVINILIIVNIILSWIRPNPENPIVKLVYTLTEPLLSPFRKFATIGMIDFSPFITLIVIQFIIAPFYQMIIGMLFL
jgi:YggT family protein